MTKDEQTYADSKFHLNSPEPKSFLQTIERIKELRRVAWTEETGCDYDPHNYTADLCRVFRAKADELEADMERRIGWN